MKLSKIIAPIAAAATALLMFSGYGIPEIRGANTVMAASTSVKVKSRDWSKYTSPTAKAKLSNAERTLYERFDAKCLEYLTGTDDAILDSDGEYYTTEVYFQDLGLSRQNAFEVLKWFKRNNPQYYFIDSGATFYPSAASIFIQDFAADGEERARITNEMFDKLDNWITECSDDEETTWQRITAINRKICESVTYDSMIRSRTADSSAGKNQSMYSVLMTDESVCEGYALTFTAMANALGIDSLEAYSSGHGWNAVRFDDGKYYYVDPTWNDLDNGLSEYSEKFIGFGTVSATKFDREQPTNSESHELNESAAKWLPTISKSDYTVTASDRGNNLYAPMLRASKSNNGVMFWWESVSAASSYEFQISYKSDFSYIGDEKTMDTSRREIIYALPSDGETYYARIRAVDSSGAKSDRTVISYSNNNVLGDVDNNGKTNTADATLILKHVVGLTQLSEEEYSHADIDGNGRVNSTDATMILKAVLGLA